MCGPSSSEGSTWVSEQASESDQNWYVQTSVVWLSLASSAPTHVLRLKTVIQNNNQLKMDWKFSVYKHTSLLRMEQSYHTIRTFTCQLASSSVHNQYRIIWTTQAFFNLIGIKSTNFFLSLFFISAVAAWTMSENSSLFSKNVSIRIDWRMAICFVVACVRVLATFIKFRVAYF